MRNRVLFIMQLPPPIHGASLVNKSIAESESVQKRFDTKILPLKFISELDEMGGFSWKKIALVFPFTFRLVKILVSFQPDLVYYTIVPKGFAFYRDAFFVLIIKLSGKKIAFHLHSRGIQQSIAGSKIKKAIYKFVFRGQTAIALADSLKIEFSSLATRQILVLPNGIPEYQTNIVERNQNAPKLIFLANLFVDKGIYVFIDIIKKLKQSGANFTANIIGGDGDVKADDLKDLIRQQSLSDIVTISGAIYGDDKYQAFASASIFVHPSLDEAFPLTILEAMQSSLPVVASTVGAIPDMIDNGRTGFTCEPGNVNEFADRIFFLIQDHESRKKMEEECFREYYAKYTFKKFEKNLIKVIEQSL